MQIPPGSESPPPVVPALGQQGVNIMAFARNSNPATQKEAGMSSPCVTVKDKSFTFSPRRPPAGRSQEGRRIAKGSGVPNRDKDGKVTKKQLRRSPSSR